MDDVQNAETHDLGLAKKPRKARKSSSLTMRLTQRTRDVLEQVAEEEGRSVSELAERWIDMAAKGQADFDGRLGKGPLAQTLLTIVEFASLLAEDVAALDPRMSDIDPSMDIGVRAALSGGVGRLFALAYPLRAHGTSTPDPSKERRDLMGASWACRAELATNLDSHDSEIGGIVEALDRCSTGDVTNQALSDLEAGLARIYEMENDGVRAAGTAASQALQAFRNKQKDELLALEAWSKRGKALAETLAFTEISYRMRADARLTKGGKPGSPFSTWGSPRDAQASIEVLAERERALDGDK